jgi:imidazolonepropionase-like amidohydrolase
MQALVAGTKTGAEVLGMGAEIGTLEPGKYADLIAVEGNPLDNMTVVRSPAFVMLGGNTIVDRRAEA